MTSPPLTETAKTTKTKPAPGEPCPNCGTLEPWGRASWCPACGFYPALGGTALRTAEQVEAEGNSDLEPWETIHKGPKNLGEAIPPWVWLAMGGAIGILVVNLVARLALPLKPTHRTLCTLLECSIGFIIAPISHFSAYLFAACKSDKIGPFDFFMKPIEIWKPTFNKMPEGQRRVCGMAWGMALIFSGLIIMAGFAVDELFEDWGFMQPEQQKLSGAGLKKKRGGGEEDLESAVNRIVGQGLLDEEAVLLETRCVIIGYTLSEKGELNSLILGSAPKGRLAYVGLLSQADIPEEDRPMVLKDLQNLDELPKCHIKQGVPIKEAVWVEPKQLCLVEHPSWTTQYRLQQPKFLKLVYPGEENEKQKEGETKSQTEETLKPLSEGL